MKLFEKSPKSTQSTGATLLKTAQKAIGLHTLGGSGSTHEGLKAELYIAT